MTNDGFGMPSLVTCHLSFVLCHSLLDIGSDLRIVIIDHIRPFVHGSLPGTCPVKFFFGCLGAGVFLSVNVGIKTPYDGHIGHIFTMQVVFQHDKCSFTIRFVNLFQFFAQRLKPVILLGLQVNTPGFIVF